MCFVVFSWILMFVMIFFVVMSVTVSIVVLSYCNMDKKPRVKACICTHLCSLPFMLRPCILYTTADQSNNYVHCCHRAGLTFVRPQNDVLRLGLNSALDTNRIKKSGVVCEVSGVVCEVSGVVCEVKLRSHLGFHDFKMDKASCLHLVVSD